MNPIEFLATTGAGSCLVLIIGIAAVVAKLRENKKPGAGTPGQDKN